MFTAQSIKWYDEYSEVKLFDRLSRDFCETFIDGAEDKAHRMYAYDFARVGEDMDDNTCETHGNSSWLLRIQREIICDT
jgi:hypothetical protein